MKIIEYNGIYIKTGKESKQIERVKNIVITWAKTNNFENIYFFYNSTFSHKLFGKGWKSKQWNGEIDLMVLLDYYFIIFELKNIQGSVIGQTKKGKWKVKCKKNQLEYKNTKDYFSQCFRMKIFFSELFLQEELQKH